MDRELWKIVLAAVHRAAGQVNKTHPPKRRPQFADWLIVAMYLWAVAHDRPQSWACDRLHSSNVFRPRKRLPSVWQFNRRMNCSRTQLILSLVHEDLGREVHATALSYLDGKPLAVGVASKDRDAARGPVMGGWAKGYKLHAWMSEDRRIPLWCVTPLNRGEVPVAPVLVEQIQRPLSPRSLTLADSHYDTYDLHKELSARGGRLVTPLRQDPKTGQRHPVSLRQMGPARRELIEVKHKHPHLVRLVYRQRINAEGILGNLCGYGGGLTALPPWVRRLYRVRRWVGSKIILYHARLHARSRQKKAASCAKLGSTPYILGGG